MNIHTKPITREHVLPKISRVHLLEVHCVLNQAVGCFSSVMVILIVTIPFLHQFRANSSHHDLQDLAGFFFSFSRTRCAGIR